MHKNIPLRHKGLNTSHRHVRNMFGKEHKTGKHVPTRAWCKAVEQRTRVRPLKRDERVQVLDARPRRGLDMEDVSARMDGTASQHLIKKVERGYEPRCVGPACKVVECNVPIASNYHKSRAMNSQYPVLTATLTTPRRYDRTAGQWVEPMDVGTLTFKFVSENDHRGDKDGRAHVDIYETTATGTVIRWPSAFGVALDKLAEGQYEITACRIKPTHSAKNGLKVGANPVHTWNARQINIMSRGLAIVRGLIPADEPKKVPVQPEQYVKFAGLTHDADGIEIAYKEYAGIPIILGRMLP